MNSRAEKAGVSFAENIIEMAHLMYQKNTSSNFYKGLMKRLLHEQMIRTLMERKMVLNAKISNS